MKCKTCDGGGFIIETRLGVGGLREEIAGAIRSCSACKGSGIVFYCSTCKGLIQRIVMTHKINGDLHFEARCHNETREFTFPERGRIGENTRDVWLRVAAGIEALFAEPTAAAQPGEIELRPHRGCCRFAAV